MTPSVLSRRRLLQIAACAALAPAGAQARTWEGMALGARARISLTGPTLWVAQAFAAIEEEVAKAERLFSLYRSDSALVQLNTQGRLPAPPRDWVALCALIDQVHGATDGQFDPTVQPLWQALATNAASGNAQPMIGWDRVRHGSDAVTLQPGQALTLNGIAQGWATDRVAERLRAMEADHVLVQLGETRALGGPFRIGLPGTGHATLQNRALATSEPGAMPLSRASHILSPNGRPALWSAVTIEASDAALADGLSTAAVFLTDAELRKARNSLPGVARIWAVSPDQDITLI